MIKWEKLAESGDAGKQDTSGYLARTKIPGGWLVRRFMGEAGGITFVPDPEHQWDGNSLP